MVFKAGHVAYIGLDNAAGAVQNVSSYGDNIDWPQPVDMLDVSVFGTVSKAFIPGLIDGAQVTIAGPMDATMWTQLTALKAAQAAGSSTASLLYGPGGSVAGQPKVSAECYVANVAPSNGVGGRAELSATLQITGAVTSSTW